MKKKLYLGLVIFLITMPTIRAMDCTKDGFMCQTAYNCCNKLCNLYGFCHRGYPGTNLDPMKILEVNPHLAPNAPKIYLNPALFGYPSSGPAGPVNPGMFNTYPGAPVGYPGNAPNYPTGYEPAPNPYVPANPNDSPDAISLHLDHF